MSNEKLDRISERVYNASFVVTVILIFTASIGTAIARYSLQSDIELVPDNVLKFIKDVLYVFAIPQTVNLLGDKLPLILSLLREAKATNNIIHTTQSQDIESGLGR